LVADLRHTMLFLLPINLAQALVIAAANFLAFTMPTVGAHGRCLFVFELSAAGHGRDVTRRANRRHESVFGKDRIKRDWRMNHLEVGLGRQHQNL
jgi:hypothetical protein